MFKSVLAAAALLAVPATASAQEGGWDFGLGAGTDNRSKMASKSDGDPFAWGQATWTSADGAVYAGPAFETVKSNGSELELEVNAGWRPQWLGFDWDLNVAHKWQVDADPASDDDAWEFTAEVSRSVGPASASVQLQHSPDGTGSTEAWTWAQAELGWEFRPSWEVSAAVGRREQDNAQDYTGWNAGLTWSPSRNLDLDLRYYDTDAQDLPGDPTRYDSAVVLAVSTWF